MGLSGRVVFSNNRVAFCRFQGHFRNFYRQVGKLKILRVGTGVDTDLVSCLFEISRVFQALWCARVDRLLGTLVGNHTKGIADSHCFRREGAHVTNCWLRGLLVWAVWLVVSRV